MHQTLRKSLEADESIRESIEAAKKVIALFDYFFTTSNHVLCTLKHGTKG